MIIKKSITLCLPGFTPVKIEDQEGYVKGTRGSCFINNEPFVFLSPNSLIKEKSNPSRPKTTNRGILVTNFNCTNKILSMMCYLIHYYQGFYHTFE